MTLELNPRNGDGPDGRGARGAGSARDARGAGKSTASSASSVALTRRQREIYDFISGFVVEQGYSPSLEEIAAAFGLSSVATVHKHVKHLVDKGYLRKAWNRSRSVEPVPPEPEVESVDSLYLPILGTVAAGTADRGDRARCGERPSSWLIPADMVPQQQG